MYFERFWSDTGELILWAGFVLVLDTHAFQTQRDDGDDTLGVYTLVFGSRKYEPGMLDRKCPDLDFGERWETLTPTALWLLYDIVEPLYEKFRKRHIRRVCCTVYCLHTGCLDCDPITCGPTFNSLALMSTSKYVDDLHFLCFLFPLSPVR